MTFQTNLLTLNVKDIENPSNDKTCKIVDKEITNCIKIIANKIYSELGKACTIDKMEFDITTENPLISIKVNSINCDIETFTPEVKKTSLQLMDFVIESGYLGTVTDFDETHHYSFSLECQPIISELNKLETHLKRLFTFETSILYASTTIIKKIIAGKSIEQIKQLYIKQNDIFEKIKIVLNSYNPQVSENFTKSEIDVILNKILIKSINEQNKNENMQEWTEDEIYKLDILRVFRDIELNPSKNLSKLLKINPLDISFEFLLKIPLTEKNQAAVGRVWQSIIGNLFSKGGLESLNSTSNFAVMTEQSIYINKYLEALYNLPPQIKTIIQPFLDNLEEKQSLDTLKNFLFSNFPDMKFSNAAHEEEQIIFQTKIQPFTQTILKELIAVPDSYRLINMLGVDESEFYDELDGFVNQIFDSLTIEEQEIFPLPRIFDIILSTGEKSAIIDFHFSNFQLSNLKSYREFVAVSHHLAKGIEEYTNEFKDVSPEDPNYQETKIASLEAFQEFFEEVKSHITLDVLRKLKNINPLNYEVFELLWKHAFDTIFNEQFIQEVNSNQSLEENINKLKPYIQAKNYFKQIAFDVATKDRFNRYFEDLENKIADPQIKSYLENNNELENEKTINQMLFGNDVLLEVEKARTTPLFTNYQQRDLMRYCKLFNEANALTVEEKKELNDLIFKMQKDLPLITTLKALRSQSTNFDIPGILRDYSPFLSGIASKFVTPPLRITDKYPAGISKKHIKSLLIITSEPKDLENLNKELEQIYRKAENLLKKFEEQPTNINLNDQFTLMDLGKLNHSARLGKGNRSFVKLALQLGLTDTNVQIKQLVENSKKSKEVLEKLDLLLKPVLAQHYRDGDILAYVGKRKSAWAGKSIGLEERLTSFASNGFTHGGKLFVKDDKVMVSHVLGGYVQEPLDLYKTCVSDIWEMDLSSLISPAIQPILESIYGPNWQQSVNELYQEVENELHLRAPQQFDDVSNYQQRRISAALADHQKIIKLSGMDISGHHKAGEGSFDKIHTKFFGQDPSNDTEQICSEWASKATLAAMVETNRRLTDAILLFDYEKFAGSQILVKLESSGVPLTKDIKDYLNGIRHWKSERSFTTSAEKELITILKTQGYQPNEISLIIKIGNKEIFDLPYNKTERFKTIHPGRMVKLLVEKKCAHLKPLPPVLQKLVIR